MIRMTFTCTICGVTHAYRNQAVACHEKHDAVSALIKRINEGESIYWKDQFGRFLIFKKNLTPGMHYLIGVITFGLKWVGVSLTEITQRIASGSALNKQEFVECFRQYMAKQHKQMQEKLTAFEQETKTCLESLGVES